MLKVLYHFGMELHANGHHIEFCLESTQKVINSRGVCVLVKTKLENKKRNRDAHGSQNPMRCDAKVIRVESNKFDGNAD